MTDGEVAVDVDGSVYVGGTRFIGTSSTPCDYFVTRLTSGGQELWQRIVTQGDRATDAHLDGEGNFHLTGGGPGVREDMVTVRFSDELMPPPPPPPPALPVAPSALTLTASKGKLMLQWTDNANNETGFRIERAINGGSFVEIAQVGVNATSFVNSERPEQAQHLRLSGPCLQRQRLVGFLEHRDRPAELTDRDQPSRAHGPATCDRSALAVTLV